MRIFGDKKYGGEAVFVPRKNSTSEDDGYLMTFVFDDNKNVSQFWVLDAKNMTDVVALVCFFIPTFLYSFIYLGNLATTCPLWLPWNVDFRRGNTFPKRPPIKRYFLSFFESCRVNGPKEKIGLKKFDIPGIFPVFNFLDRPIFLRREHTPFVSPSRQYK